MSAKISDALAAGIDKVRHVLLADDNATNDRARTANPRAKTIHSERISYAGPGTVTVGVPCLTRPFAGLRGGLRLFVSKYVGQQQSVVQFGIAIF